jgi:hypothetical protein
MDMYMSESKYGLEDTSDLCIHLLDSIESTFCHATREGSYLFDTDDTLISNEEEIQFIIDPGYEYKCKKKHPIKANPSPK